jgi:hypothetical protein
MAITGLILGFLGLALWVSGFVGWRGFIGDRKTQIANFVNALAANNIPAAMAECEPRKQFTIQHDVKTVQQWGKVKEIAVSGAHVKLEDGAGWVTDVTGNIEFANTIRAFEIRFSKHNGVWKITRCTFK